MRTIRSQAVAVRLLIVTTLTVCFLGFSGPSFAQSTSPNYTGLWWNAAESGWGLNVVHQGDILFVTQFTYQKAGLGTQNPATWFVGSAVRKQIDGSYLGEWYQTVGPAFDASPFTPLTGAQNTQVGTIRLTFSGDSGTMTFTVNGTSVTKALTKLVFGVAPASCSFTDNPDRSASTNYQDLWWNANESGWGVNFTHQYTQDRGEIIFATMFNYQKAGLGLSNPPTWFVASAMVKQADGSFLGEYYRTTGSAFDANPFVPLTAANMSQVGTMRFTPINGQSGTLTYSVDGVTVVKNVTRMVYQYPVSRCTTVTQVIPPKLLALIHGDNKNGYVDIDIATFTGVQKNPGASFYAADYDAATQNIVLASPLSASAQPYTFVNVVTGATSAGLNLPYQNTQRTAVKCEPKGSSRVGICYYGFGGSFDGRVVIASGRNVVETVTLPDASLGRIPTQFAIIGDTLVVKTLSVQGSLDVLHRLNLNSSPRTWQAPIPLPIKALGIDVRGSSVYVAGFPLNFAFKVVIADVVTGSVQDLNLSLGYAGDVALSTDTMFVSELDKVKAYRLSDNAFLGNIALVGAEKLAYYNGYLFVSNAAGGAYKVNAVTRAKEAEISIPRISSGELVVIAP